MFPGDPQATDEQGSKREMKKERGNKRETEGKGKKRKEGIKEEIEKGARGKLDKEVIYRQRRRQDRRYRRLVMSRGDK